MLRTKTRNECTQWIKKVAGFFFYLKKIPVGAGVTRSGIY